MKALIKSFALSEDGAVTVDWVVLTAFLVGLSLAVVSVIRTGAIEPADSLGNWLTARQID